MQLMLLHHLEVHGVVYKMVGNKSAWLTPNNVALSVDEFRPQCDTEEWEMEIAEGENCRLHWQGCLDPGFIQSKWNLCCFIMAHTSAKSPRAKLENPAAYTSVLHEPSIISRHFCHRSGCLGRIWLCDFLSNHSGRHRNKIHACQVLCSEIIDLSGWC